MKYIFFLMIFFTFDALAVSHHPTSFLEQIQGTPDEGEQIVQHFCSTCHAEKPMIALGAPRRGILSDWQSRISQGVDVLFKHTNEGFRAMPPRGGCFECSDAQLMSAINALLPKELSNRPSKD